MPVTFIVYWMGWLGRFPLSAMENSGGGVVSTPTGRLTSEYASARFTALTVTEISPSGKARPVSSIVGAVGRNSRSASRLDALPIATYICWIPLSGSKIPSATALM
eukprot:3503902-Prymnesium_polylepis.1